MVNTTLHMLVFLVFLRQVCVNGVWTNEHLFCSGGTWYKSNPVSFFADNLLFVINSIKQEIVNRVQVPKDDRGVNMEQRLNVLIKDTLGKQ